VPRDWPQMAATSQASATPAARGSAAPPTRRALLSSTALLLVARAAGARAETLAGGAGMPWRPFAGDPPPRVEPGPWIFFTPEEGMAVEALVDRLIPPDPETPGGKDCGCGVFIDRQLAGSYGSARGLYMSPPFLPGTAEQGLQSPATPAQLYRQALAALDAHCRATYAGKAFAQLPESQQDRLITGMENGSLQLHGTSATPFFEALLQDTQYGFFADPIYGGNRDMAAWKMIGFPGVRYDYRDWVERYNERYPLPPVGIAGRKEWSAAPK
jgi:gluconate 2-dehydrogenase gamma chain